jgi:hypothetical protein
VIEQVANFPFDHTTEGIILGEPSEPLVGSDEWIKQYSIFWEREMSDHENEDATSNAEEGEVTFGFPIVDTTTEFKMKNIPPQLFQTCIEW